MKSREYAYSARSAGVRSCLARLTPTYTDRTCPQGHPWQDELSSRNDGNIGTFLGALKQLIESPSPFKAVRLEIDGGQVEEPDAEGRHE